MEELYSKEELGKLVVERAIQDIESWASKELTYITYKSNKPICISVGKNTWLVGHYKIVKNKRKQFAVYSTGNLINKFANKQAAFLYSIMSKIKNYELSHRILNSDVTFSRLQEEQDILLSKRKNYIKTSNYFKLSLIDAKLSDISLKLYSARKDLEKNLIRAKYVKVY